MEIYKFDINTFPKIDDEIVLCLGFFDGLHKGHISLLEEAKKYGKKTAVLSFDNSSFNLFKHSKFLLTPSSEKIRILSALNIDYYFELNMSEELVNTSKEVFIKKLNSLNPELCVCGRDYTFGKNKEGNADYLSLRIPTKIVDFKMIENKKISSRIICENLLSGNTEIANEFLGRNYAVQGKVENGLGNGRKLGFETANLSPDDNYFMPKEGVYFGLAEFDGKKYASLASYGVHPTIDKLEKPILEILILNFHGNLYNKIIRFEFLKYHRDILKFSSTTELKEQLKRDKKIAELFFLKEK